MINVIEVNIIKRYIATVMESKEHQLTAILFSDIVGYSAAMGRDESEAWEMLQFAKSLHQDCAEKYHGKIIKELGDGFLIRFSSVIDAVHCAKELIGGIKDQSFKIRIGVHLGDVIEKDGDVYGDGVNIAARLQQEANENEVLISESVFLNIKNQTDIETHPIGKVNLKNIDQPLTLYKLRDGKVHSRKSGKNFTRIFIVSAIIISVSVFLYTYSNYSVKNNHVIEPSIAILPFENLSMDPEQEYFSTGVSDEIRTKLGFINGLTVRGRSSSVYFKGKSITLEEIANTLNVNYVLEGSVRILDNKAFFNLSLVDTRNDKVILPIQIENKVMDDLFQVQTEIAMMVAEKLQTTLLPEEVKILEKIPTMNPEAHRYYLLARHYYLQEQSRENIYRCLNYLDEAINLDRNFAEAYAMKANVLMLFPGWGYQRTDSIITLAKPLAEKALELNPNLSDAYYALGNIYYFQFDLINAFRQHERARELDPENDLIYLGLGFTAMIAQEYEMAVEYIKRAIKLNPYSSIASAQLGLAYFNLGEYDSATAYLKESIERFPAPENDFAKWVLAGVYQSKGDFQKSIEYYLSRSAGRSNVNFALGYAYGRSGQADSARKVLTYLLKRSKESYVPPSEIGLVYAGLGVEDSTYYWMKKAHLQKDWLIVRWIPLFDSLLTLAPYKDWFGLSGLDGEMEQL